MDSPTALLLKALKNILASPALRGSDDKALTDTMNQADIVLASLVARHAEMPSLVEAARATYAQLLPRLRQACAGDASAAGLRATRDGDCR